MKEWKKTNGRRRGLMLLIVAVGLIALAGGYYAFDSYKKFFYPNPSGSNGEPLVVYIPSNSNLDTVINLLVRQQVISDRESFKWVAGVMNYEKHIYGGRYFIKPGVSNRELVQLLRSGKQTPLKLVINNVRTKEELVSKVCSKLEADSFLLLTMLNDKVFLRQYGLIPENAMAVFIPNTYEFYWTTDAHELFERMLKEFKKFWTPSRLNKAKKLGLEPLEVITLASIVEQETIREEEKKIVAGVYINRLKKGWKLQADPTVKFALKQFELQRVLNSHIVYDSPYNTYLYDGLPPGPICLPELKVIDAVLNYEQHNYMYFCARDDFSGYHNFAATLDEHLANARKYRDQLNKNKIWQ